MYIKANRCYELLQNALIVHRESWPYKMQGHGPGTTVVALDPGAVPLSPTGFWGELPVTWSDSVGRTWTGWLGRTALLKAGVPPIRHVPYDLMAPHTAHDQLRDKVVHSTLSPLAYVIQRADTQLLREVIRELGGTIPKTDDRDQILRIALRLIYNEEVSMADKKAAQAETEGGTATASRSKAGKKGGEKAAAKAATKRSRRAAEETEDAEESGDEEEATERTSAGVGLGEKLLEIAAIKGDKDAKKLASRLADGEDLSKAQLTSLRDKINEIATACRAEDDGTTASQLSALNRQVRRMARAAE